MFSIFFQYPSFLVFLAIFITAAIVLVLNPLWIKLLKKARIGQQVRADGPQSHLVKQGTPTMGGIIMVVAVLLAVLIIGKSSAATYALMAATIFTAAVGLFDDASKVIKERSLGLTPKAKLFAQFVIATAFCLFAVNFLDIEPTVNIPFITTFDLGILTTVLPFGEHGFSIPWLYLLFVDILLMGMCNAVNLTDGLDGLAAGTVM